MTYLAFIFATGLYLLLGPGGPLHSDKWFDALRRRVDAIEPQFWVGFVLMVVVPCTFLALVYALLDQVFGGAAMLIVGTAALFFSFGRADLPALLERFMARSRAGDNEGAALVLEEAGADIEADDEIEFGRLAARTFVYEGYQRWFPAAFYFLLLGPFWAVAYRLIQLASDDRRVPVGSLRHLLDWLPSRTLMLTLAIIGNFDATRRVIAAQAMDANVETDTLLVNGLEASAPAQGDEPAQRVASVEEALRRAMIAWVVLASVVAILS